MAARVDRLPMSFMAWEICLIVQVGWAMSASTDGIALRLYPFVWLPAKVITHSQYDVLYALQVGISILLGGYALGWLADKIGRRKALILSSLLAAPAPSPGCRHRAGEWRLARPARVRARRDGPAA